MIRFLVSSIFSYVVMAIIAMILFRSIFAEAFEPLQALFRPTEEQANTIKWAMASQFFRTFFFTYILYYCVRDDNFSIFRGVFVAMIMGLFVSTYHFANAASLPLPPSTAIAWGLFDGILLIFGGVAFCGLYGLLQPKHKSSL